MFSSSTGRTARAAVVIAMIAGLTPNAIHGQQISACYTKQNGTLYRVGTANTPSTCTNPTHTLETWGAKIDANGVLSLTNANGLVAAGTIGQGNIPASGAGTRMMWYPAKAAFRAGSVDDTQWDIAKIGLASFAGGFSTTASGEYSTALGLYTWASGKASVAIGYSAAASAKYSVALGPGTIASGDVSTAVGYNSTASGEGSVAIGTNLVSTGYSTTTEATGTGSVAIGDALASRGARSVVLGSYAKALQAGSGSFVFGDGSGSLANSLEVNTPNSFVARATGGVQFITGVGGCSLPAGGGQWACASSRLLKTDFADVDGEGVLAKLREMPVQSWSYSAEGPARHIGPMSQDFHAAFGLGSDDKTIGVLDAAGVSIMGVKALEARTTQLQQENAQLRSALAGLEARLAAVEGPHRSRR